MERVVSEGTGYLDSDTVVSMRSMDAALRGAGAACQAIDLIMTGEATNAFVPVRPPGHHATLNARWVSVFSTMSRWRRVMRKTITRKLNASQLSIGMFTTGTEHRAFFMTTLGVLLFHPPVSVVSGHRLARRERNWTRRRLHAQCPFARAHSRNEQKRMFEAALDDIAAKFKPDLILISAGFDSHNGDPLGQLLLEDEDFIS